MMQYSEGYKKQSCVVKGLGSWECLEELIQGYVAVPHVAEKNRSLASIRQIQLL